MIDYRKILISYISMVGECEGIDFLGYGPSDKLEGMTEEEGIELAKIRDLGRGGYKAYYDSDGNVTNNTYDRYGNIIGKGENQ